MANFYLIHAPHSTVQQQLNKIIEVKAEDTITTHLANIFLIKNDDKLSGYCKSNHFKLWFYSNWYTGAFYPVLSGEIIDRGNETVLKIWGRLNPFAFVLCLTMSISVLAFFHQTGSPIFSTDLLLTLLKYKIAVIILLLTFNCPLIICYYVTKNAIIKELKEKLQLQEK